MQFSRIQEIFSAILDLPSDERHAALEQACAGDGALRAEVASLLAAHGEAGAFLGSPTEAYGICPAPSVGRDDRVGSTIGRYMLVQQIGEGGFGVVYAAKQIEPIQRRVALKIIKLGMDTRQVIARFEAERQALAMMDHPNIAQVYDAGATAEGRPFFVMELVSGVPITDYFNRERLPTRKRLELFLQVCQAIQHAHQKGIIHRDLKPSNVLVTIAESHPQVKVIDFGIAKATRNDLTEKTVFTEFRQFIGTPEYMSPEQADRSTADIDTRSDVYSLGVLLYEILTGTTPLDGQRLRSLGSNELQRVICNEDPPTPSQRISTLGERLVIVARAHAVEPTGLGSLIQGELDWIVMKAMDKDRTRRYPSAQSLADDVERFLRDEPIEAGPTRFSYRFAKFARRHRALIASAAAAFLVLMLGLVGTSQGLVWALRERDRAQLAEKTAAEHAEKTKRFISLIGSPLMQPDDVHRFKRDWHAEIDRSRVERGADHPDQIAEECRFASWLGFTSLTNDLPDLADEASRYQEQIQRRAKGILTVEDPVYASLLMARIQTTVFVHLRNHRSLNVEWIDDIDATTARKLMPLYEELMVGLKAYMPEDDAKYQQIRLEQVWMQIRAGEVPAAMKSLESYANWYERVGMGGEARFMDLHRQHIRITAEMLKGYALDYPQLYQRIKTIADRHA